MYRRNIVVQQIASPIRRPAEQRATLIGLKLNRIGRIAELPNTDQIQGMISKLPHLVRIIGWTAKLDDQFINAVRAEYKEIVINRIERGNVLWAQFEEAVTACRAESKFDGRNVVERINELAVAKMLSEDKTITGTITYEPDLFKDGRKIDFVVDRGDDNLYIEVKTVEPRIADTDQAWQKFLKRKEHHPEDVNFIVEKEWMGGAIYGNVFAARSRFLQYTREFEERLAAAKKIKQGPGILIFCGTGFAWHKSNLEDFADYYHTGIHRGDDAFALMEAHHIKSNNIELMRNVDHFAFLRRHIESLKLEQFFFPIRGPRFFIPPPQPLPVRQ